MPNVIESELFQAKYRAVLRHNAIKLFTPNDEIWLHHQVNFDIQSEQKSAMDHFATALLGGLLHSVKSHFARQRADILEMEGKIWLDLANPLTLLGVRGYNTPPKIQQARIKIFISSDLEERTFTRLTQEALKNCFIYNSLSGAFEIDVAFEQVI